MPAQAAESLSPVEFSDLISFLASLKQATPPAAARCHLGR